MDIEKFGYLVSSACTLTLTYNNLSFSQKASIGNPAPLLLLPALSLPLIYKGD